MSRLTRIRNHVRDLLLDKTRAGKNVFNNQASKQWSENLPAIIIYSQSEQFQMYGDAPREYRRTSDLTLEIIAEGGENPVYGEAPSECEHVETILDDIVEQCICELYRDDALGEDPQRPGKTMVDDIQPVSLEYEFDPDGVKPTGTCIFTLTVTYHSFIPESSDKQTQLNAKPFKTAHVEYDVTETKNDEDDGVQNAESTIELPQ